MANFRIRIAAVLAALAFLLPAQENTPPANGGKPVDAAARPRGPTIGVVDLDKARENYPKAIAEREKLVKLSQSFRERMDELEKRIDQLRGEVQLLKQGSGEREFKEVELGLAMQQLKGLSTVFQNEFDRAKDKFELMIYQDLEAAVAQVAKDRGVQIVMRVMSQDPPEAGAKDPTAQQIRLSIFNRRAVWYAADEVDLTTALIKYLQVPLAPKPESGKPESGKPESGKSESGKTEVPTAPKPAGNGNGGQ